MCDLMLALSTSYTLEQMSKCFKYKQSKILLDLDFHNIMTKILISAQWAGHI